MKTNLGRILSLTVFCATSGAIATSQNVPDSPAPASIADPAWSRLESLLPGQPIIVTAIDGHSVHCLFTAATDRYLFCNPPENLAGRGFRFDHAGVIGVDLDLPRSQMTQSAPRHPDCHPAWISSMIAGGIIVGLVASQNTTAGRAAEDGLIGAGIVGLIGAPLAFLPHHQLAIPRPVGPPGIFGAQLRIPLSTHIRQ